MSNKHTIHVDGQLWHAFRIASLQRHTNASAEISAFVAARMKEWGEPVAAARPAPVAKKATRKAA